MNLSSIVQKLQRFINVCLTDTPTNFDKKKLEILTKLYHVTNDYMKNTGANYWLDYGTLLGHYREGNILMHDADVDFGAHEDEFDKIWSHRQSLPKGFKLYDTSFKHRGPKLYFNYKGFDADVYFYEEKEGTLTSYEDSHFLSERSPFPINLALPVKPTIFLGEDTFEPAEPKLYLEHIYHYLGSDGNRDSQTGYWRKK